MVAYGSWDEDTMGKIEKDCVVCGNDKHTHGGHEHIHGVHGHSHKVHEHIHKEQ